MELEEFVTNLVTVDYKEDAKAFGHFPFQMISEDSEEGLIIGALLLQDVREVYAAIKTQLIKKNTTKVFFSVDFPAMLDIKNDFIVVFSIENKEVKLFAIPYNTETGELYDRVYQSRVLDHILDNFNDAMGN